MLSVCFISCFLSLFPVVFLLFLFSTYLFVSLSTIFTCCPVAMGCWSCMKLLNSVWWKNRSFVINLCHRPSKGKFSCPIWNQDVHKKTYYKSSQKQVKLHNKGRNGTSHGQSSIYRLSISHSASQLVSQSIGPSFSQSSIQSVSPPV